MPYRPRHFRAREAGAACSYYAYDLALNDGDAVATWTDGTGYARNMTQATSGSRPIFKTNILNGMPVVRFDGTDDFLGNTTIGLDLLSSKPGATFFAVVARDVTTAPGSFSPLMFVSRNTGTSARAILGAPTGATGVWSAGGRRTDADSFASVNFTASYAANAFHIVCAVIDYANSNLFLYQDGAAAGSSTSFQTDGNSASSLTVNHYLGYSGTAGSYFDGDIAEISLFPEAISDGVRRRLEIAASLRYNIPIAA